MYLLLLIFQRCSAVKVTGQRFNWQRRPPGSSQSVYRTIVPSGPIWRSASLRPILAADLLADDYTAMRTSARGPAD